MFWDKWTKPTKVLYLISLLMLAVAMVFLFFYHLLGVESLFSWDIQFDIQNVEVTIDHVRHKVFDLPVQSENFVVFQYFSPTNYTTSIWASAIYVFILGFVVSLGIAVVTTYKKLVYFMLGCVFFVAWLTFLNLDLLGVFGFYNNGLLASMLVVYLGLAYYFYAWNESISFIIRVVSFLCVTTCFGCIIFFGSEVAHPIVHLASFGTVGVGIVFLFFLCIIGYEVLQLALSVMTMSRNSNPWSTPLNFLIITALYIGNTIVYYLYLIKEISWSLPYNVYLFFPICTVLGIWSHRKRSVLYTNILPYAPGGAFLYLTLAIGSVATLGYVSATHLTPALQVFEVAFIVTQGAFGLAFFAYSLRNFYKPMVTNMPVHKMIFDPRLTPHYMLRCAAVALLFFFIGGNRMKLEGQLKSAYFTLKGNFYKSSGDYLVAEANYKDALKTFPGGHLASIGLASIYLEQDKRNLALDVLSGVNKDESSEFLYISLANLFKETNQGMKQLLMLQEAVKAFPKSQYVANNLGMAFHELNIVDSSIFYMNKAIELSNTPISNANYLGIAAKRGLFDGKKMDLDQKFVKDEAYMANAYVIANLASVPLNQEFDFDNLKEDGSGLMLSLVNNYVDKNIHQVPVKLVQRINDWKNKFDESPNADNINFIQAKTLFYNGYAQKGLERLHALTKQAGTYQIPFFSNFAALMNIKVGLYNQAYEYLFAADQMTQLNPDLLMRENTAVMALETGDFEYAKLLFPYLAQHNPTNRDQYISIAEVLQGKENKTPYQKAINVLFLHPANYTDVLSQMPESKLKHTVLVNLIEQELNQENKPQITDLWKLMPSQIEDKELFLTSNLLNMRTLCLFGDANGLEKKIKTLPLAPFDSRWKTYFEALVFQTKGDTLNASKKYASVIEQFPKNEPIWTTYIRYHQQKGDKKQAYDMCAEYLMHNKRTIKMLQLYVDLSLSNNLYPFADETIEELRMMMDPKEFELYSAQYKKVRGIDSELE